MSNSVVEENVQEATPAAGAECQLIWAAGNKDMARQAGPDAVVHAAGCKPQSFWLRAWSIIRELSGDDAYERYLAHHSACHPGSMPLARKDFFRNQQQKKWGGIQRCC